MKRWGARIAFEILINGMMFGWVFIYACAPPPPPKAPAKPYQPPVIVEKRVPILCMEKPPAVTFPTWPDSDRMGNVLLHRSTVDAFKDGAYTLQKYIAAQYLRCYKAAVQGFEPSDVGR